jgi:phosphoribosylglycinamide formyltransferase-1
MDATLRERGVEITALAGYMRVFTPWFVSAWKGRMINIHPSLLPAFPGLDTHRRALEAGVKLHGCTVHLVSDEVDQGPILGQAAVPVLEGDTEASLAARVLRAEHRLYRACLARLASGQGGGMTDEGSILLNV